MNRRNIERSLIFWMLGGSIKLKFRVAQVSLRAVRNKCVPQLGSAFPSVTIAECTLLQCELANEKKRWEEKNSATLRLTACEIVKEFSYNNRGSASLELSQYNEPIDAAMRTSSYFSRSFARRTSKKYIFALHPPPPRANPLNFVWALFWCDSRH